MEMWLVASWSEVGSSMGPIPSDDSITKGLAWHTNTRTEQFTVCRRGEVAQASSWASVTL